MLVLTLAIAMAACLGTAATIAPSGPEPAATKDQDISSQFTVTPGVETTCIPDDIPAEMVESAIDNPKWRVAF